jgi:hypothetical protein
MITLQDQKEAIYDLWDRVAESDGANAETAPAVLLEGCCALLPAGNACLSINVRLPVTERRDPLWLGSGGEGTPQNRTLRLSRL